ncbi:MAG: serine O-acetyltransferase [Trueperaceae bacterium]
MSAFPTDPTRTEPPAPRRGEDASESNARLDDFLTGRFDAHRHCPSCPSPREAKAWFDDLIGLLFPALSERRFETRDDLLAFESRLHDRTAALIQGVPGMDEAASRALAVRLREALPDLHAALEEDAQAIVDGDPAARGRYEVIRTYPGFHAIAAHRVAYLLHHGGAWLLARTLAASAHAQTAIDIHPAARIGRRFCIDHGTGVVIGETAVIGNDVKVYQGVTLGGLSVRKEDARRKRHPTVEDRVVLYAGATVLGGDTVIGHDAVIGGSVFLTKSVPPYAQVAYRPDVRVGDGSPSQTTTAADAADASDEDAHDAPEEPSS